MKTLALIPARGGSSTVPRKNIKPLNGKPLIAYTIEAALQASAITSVIVSTDDEEIAQTSRELGANVPFLRPSEFATATAGDLGVIQHALEFLKEQGEEFDAVAYLRPTSPFKTGALIDTCIEKLSKHDAWSGLRTVTRVEAVNHPYWMYKEGSNSEILEPFIEGIDISKYYRRQLLPTCYRLNGVVDLTRVTNINAGNLYGDKIGFHEIDDKTSMDIDNQFEFDICDLLMQKATATG